MRKTKEKECKHHGMTIFAERGPKGKTFWRCRKCEYDSLKRRRKKLKLELVDYKGGKCEACGYDRCIEALEFHHTDPAEKDFAITAGVVIGLEKLKVEVDKCVLLCANCHREEHVRLRIDVP